MVGVTWAGVKAYLNEFCLQTTLHGFVHFVHQGRHRLERLAWILTVIGSLIAALWIIINTLLRYINNPVVVTIDRNYRQFVIDLPAITICYIDRLDDFKAMKYIPQKWNVTTGPKYMYYMRFLNAVVNSSLLNLGAFNEFANDEELRDFNIIEAMRELTVSVKDVNGQSFGRDRMFFNYTLLETGICFSAFSSLAVALADLSFGSQMKTTAQWAKCTPNERFCFAIAQDFPRDPVVYFHAQTEVPHIFTPPSDPIKEFSLLNHILLQWDFTSSENLRNLWFSQRKCHLYTEKVYDHLPGYSYNLCAMECRKKLAELYCKCVPHFYYNPTGKYCDPAGLACVANNIDKIIEQTRAGKGNKCKCYAACDDQAFSLYKIESQGDLTSVVRWQSLERSKTRYRKDVMFEFADLLVYFGGTAALFLGCSVMSIIEVPYFFTIRLLRYVNKKPKPTENPIQTKIPTLPTENNRVFSRRLQRRAHFPEYALNTNIYY